MTPSAGSLIVTALAVAFLLALVPRLVSLIRVTLGVKREVRARRAAREPDLTSARAYHDLLPARERTGAIDHRTWRDLDMDDVFCRLDFTVSEPGRQYLYHTVRAPSSDRDPLARLDRAVRQLDQDDASAERVRAALGRLQDPRATRLVNLVFEDLPERPRLWLLFPVLTTAAVTCLALAPFRASAIVWWIGVSAVNLLVQVLYKPGVRQFVPAMHEVPAFVRAASELGAVRGEGLAEERRLLGEGARELRSLLRATRWLMFEPGQVNDVLASLYEYVNLLFLLDVNAFVFSVESLRASRDRLRGMFEALGFIDAAQAVAAWRRTLGQWCLPEFTDPRKALHVEGVVHPLVTDAVPNSLAIDGSSVLISGSNMAGKTTFVRALGVNAVLAQTLATVCATAWKAPFLRVRSCIGRADSVVEGKSYYLAEVEAVLALIQSKDEAEQHLFLLDETFRGTNTTERVAAAFAVLKYLDRGLDIVVVATHDLEVLDLLNGEYAPHHFREQIVHDELTFDYQIQPGPSSTRNAIALLKFMHYPDGLVGDAVANLDWQERRGAPRRSERADAD